MTMIRPLQKPHSILSAFILLCTVTLLTVSNGQAQTRYAPSIKFDGAWFGTVGAGLVAHDNGPFSRRLQSYTPQANGENLVYRTEEFAHTGYTLNAGGAFLFGEYLIGANGEMVTFPTVHSITSPGMEQDEYALTGGGGNLEFGYALVNDDATLVYPFANIGYYGYTLEYTNNQSDSIPFFEDVNPVPPGTTATFTGAAPRIGLGIGLTKFIGSKGESSVSGFVINARLAWGTMPSRPRWERDGTEVNNGGHTPCYNGISLSLSIGGGTGWW